jgi:DNA-binding response OmpR family regulator
MGKVVLYEDDDLMRGLLKEWLQGAGYQVRVSATNEDAPPTGGADLVIVSIRTPRSGGFESLRAIKRRYPRTPLIALSGQFRSGLSAAGATAQQLGVTQVIAKPLTRDELLRSVRAIMGAPALSGD